MLTHDSLALTLAITPIPMMLADATGRIIAANADFEELFGYEPGSLGGARVDDLVPSDMRAAHSDLRHAFHVLPAKRKMGGERAINGQARDGSILPLELALQPVEVEGKPFVLVSALDLRTRQQNRQRISNIMDAASCTMLVVDPEGRIEFVNEVVTDLLGHAVKDLMGKSVECLIAANTRRAHRVYRRSYHCLETQAGYGHGRTVHALHKDGRLIPVEVMLNPLDLDGRDHVVATMVDLSERIATEEAMAQRALELERLNADLNQFARGISHDLKAPITSIAGLLNICLEDLEDGNHGELAENLGKAIAIAERSVADIEQVLSVISNPEQDAMPEPVDLAVMAQEIWDDLNGSETGRRFELDLLSGCDPVVERATLRTVLRHLFSNAIRYRDEARAPLEVRLQTLVTEGVFTLTLSDNGVGMPERFLSQAFDLFTRCDDRGGAGIGLNLVKRNMERLGGTAEVASTLGVGTVVTLTLPLKQKELAA